MAETSQVPEGTSSQANAPKDSRPVYEVGFHVLPTVDESKVGETVEKIRAELAKGGAEIINEQFPQKMSLAYTVEQATSGKHEKFNESYFGFIKFATERENIPALEQMLRTTREVLRYLLIQTVREDAPVRRAIYSSSRLEGETIKKPVAPEEKPVEVSEEELNKSIDAIVS